MTRFFIGSDNRTRKINTEYLRKIETLAGLYSKGFTIYNSRGFWEGKGEDSVILEIGGLEDEKSRGLAADLKRELGQEAVGVQFLPEIEFV